MKTLGLDSATINLDAGVRTLPYSPDIDVRDFVDFDEIVSSYGLGPNGAMIAGMDLTATKIDEIKDELDYLSPEYVLVDTPGQIELFAYRNSGVHCAQSLVDQSVPSSIFMLDPALAHSESSFASLMLLGVSVMYRFNFPQIFVLSKNDLVDKEVTDRIEEWATNPQRLVDSLSLQKFGLLQSFSFHTAQILQSLNFSLPFLPISAKRHENMDGLLGTLQAIWGVSQDSFDIS